MAIRNTVWLACLAIGIVFGCKPKPEDTRGEASSVASAGDARKSTDACQQDGFGLRNGEEIKEGSANYKKFAGVGLVSRRISETSRRVCTGTLVSPAHVLTARHCLTEDRDKQLKVVDVAKIRFEPLGDRVEKAVKKIILPDYSIEGEPEYVDAALLVLENPIENLPHYAVYTGDEFPLVKGEEVETVGYGWHVSTEEEVDASIGKARFGKMKFDTVGRVTSEPVGPFDVAVLRAGDKNQLSCEGDSGGPAFFDFGGASLIVGLISASLGGGETSLERCHNASGIELAPSPEFAKWLLKHVPEAKPTVQLAQANASNCGK